MIVALRGGENALIMMGELDQVDSIALGVVRVDFLSSLQVIETDAKVFTARDKILAIVADVHGVYLLFLYKKQNCEFAAKTRYDTYEVFEN